MKLDEGQPFPDLSVPLVDGGKLDVPGDLRGAWSILLFYRGRW